jgi:hypothetical protein
MSYGKSSYWWLQDAVIPLSATSEMGMDISNEYNSGGLYHHFRFHYFDIKSMIYVQGDENGETLRLNTWDI